MNNKGKSDSGPMAIVMAVFVGIFLLVFLTGGGLSAAWDITKLLSDIPTWLWVVFGIIVIFKLLGGKK